MEKKKMKSKEEKKVKFNIDAMNYGRLKLRNRKFNKEEFKLLSYLMTFIQWYQGQFYHSFEDIAYDMEVSEKHVRNTCKKLIERNFISVVAKAIDNRNNKNKISHFHIEADTILEVIDEVFNREHTLFEDTIKALLYIKELTSLNKEEIAIAAAPIYLNDKKETDKSNNEIKMEEIIYGSN